MLMFFFIKYIKPIKKILKYGNTYTFLVSSFVVFIIIYIFFSWHKFLNDKKQTSITQNLIIRSTLLNNFDYANRVNKRIIEKINYDKTKNLKNILNIFLAYEKTYLNNIDIFSWSSFDYVDNNNFQLVNTKLGIRKPPPNMSHRKYVVDCKKEPLKLKLSKITLGEPSETMTIPAGTGFLDKNNNFAGIIVVGFDINKLKNSIFNNLTDKKIDFTVIDFDGDFIMDSSGNKSYINDHFISKKTLQYLIDKPNSEFNFIENNVRYNDFKILNDYGYIIFTGYDKNYLIQQFLINIKDYLVSFAIFLIFFLIILSIFKYSIFKIINEEKELSRQLQISNISKLNLIRATGHDLKNYIFGISGILKLLLKEESINKESKELIKLADEQSDELVYFLEDLLDTNQNIDKNFGNEKFDKHNLNNLINRITLLNKSLILHNKINIIFDLDKDLKEIFCDGRRVKQILNNLLNNSIKYSPEKTSITFKTYNYQDQIIFEIKDQGIGMTQKEIKHALEGNCQFIDKSQLKKCYDSYGIGLKNVQELIKQNNATLEIESIKGQGSTFRITFPMIGYSSSISNLKYKK